MQSHQTKDQKRQMPEQAELAKSRRNGIA